MSRPICLQAEDAVEFAELCEFLADWIAHDHQRADRSLTPFVACAGYDVGELQADLRRFAFLLGGTNPRLVVGDEGADR